MNTDILALDLSLESAAKNGISWTKRAQLVADSVAKLVDLGRELNEEPVVINNPLVTIVVTKTENSIEVSVTGNITQEHHNVGLRLDTGTLTLDTHPCDLNAINQKIAQILLSNKPQEQVTALVYC